MGTVQFESIEDIRDEFKQDGDFHQEYNTVKDVINTIISRGNEEHVYAFSDEHLSLSNLDSDLLNLDIDDLGVDDKYEDDIIYIVDQANIVNYYYNREITEEIQEEIDEDKMIRGIDDDD